MFNNFDLSDQEILKIIEDYKNLINKNSVVSGSFDEDLQQEIKFLIFRKNRSNKGRFFLCRLCGLRDGKKRWRCDCLAGVKCRRARTGFFYIDSEKIFR